MSSVKTFEALLEKGPDSAMLRYSLANAYVSASNYAAAIVHLKKALEHDPQYSAAWKLLGRSYYESGELAGAVKTYEQGIEIADDNGDKQASKEMATFLRRATKLLDKD